MPTAKQLNLQEGEKIEMRLVGYPKHSNDEYPPWKRERVLVEVLEVDEHKTKIKYLEESIIQGKQSGETDIILHGYAGFSRLDD